MKIIDEKNWSHVLFENDGKWILTFLVWVGRAEADMSILLTDEDRSLIEQRKSYISELLEKAKSNKEFRESRIIIPPMWPK